MGGGFAGCWSSTHIPRVVKRAHQQTTQQQQQQHQHQQPTTHTHAHTHSHISTFTHATHHTTTYDTQHTHTHTYLFDHTDEVTLLCPGSMPLLSPLYSVPFLYIPQSFLFSFVHHIQLIPTQLFPPFVAITSEASDTTITRAQKKNREKEKDQASGERTFLVQMTLDDDERKRGKGKRQGKGKEKSSYVIAVCVYPTGRNRSKPDQTINTHHG